MLFLTVNAPMAQITTMTGAMIGNGTRRMAANNGTMVRTTISPAILPRYMLAIRPHTKSFCSTNRRGPGCSPQIMSPPSSTAAVGDPGMTSVLMGSGAELVSVCGHPAGDTVAHERRRGRAARDDAHPAADDAAAQRGCPVARQLLPGLQHDLRVDLRAVPGERQSLLHREQDLTDTEQTDHRDQEMKTR